MIYRREIDGLRAVAVLPVILFHAGLEVFSGGFLGVDVFFVISGYLITTIILDDLARGQFSLLQFYERRARRILPALTLVVLACVPFAWAFMLPDPLENFGQSAFATMLSLNNVLLTKTSGYWELASEFKPLIHTWSLAVEEQFYLLVPLLLMVLYPRSARAAALVVLVLVLASYSASILLVDRYPTSTFYLLHTRAWELGVGSLGAFLTHRRAVAKNGLAAGLGLGMILISMLLFDEHVAHPSALTAVPVMGTLLVLLYARDGTGVARLLGLPVLVGVGLISYSLYLWHQPLFAFARIVSFEEPGLPAFLALTVLCFGLAYGTWRFVEQPFRNRAVVSTRALTGACVAATIGLSAIGLGLHFAQGVPSRVFATSAETAAGMHIGYNHRIRAYIADRFEEGAGARVLVVGNSHARDFGNVLLEMKELRDLQLVYRSVPGDPTGLDVCAYPNLPLADAALIDAADVIFVPVIDLPESCRALAASDRAVAQKVVFVGPKHFGYNLNAFIQGPREARPKAKARVFDEIVTANRANAAALAKGRYIDLIAAASEDGETIRVFDDAGDILSADRVHITKAGAEFFATAIRGHAGLEVLRAAP